MDAIVGLPNQILYGDKKYTVNPPLTEEMAAEFHCNICLSICNKPVFVCKANHFNCRVCIEKWASKSPHVKCPTCRKDLAITSHRTFSVNKPLASRISCSVKVKCPNECGVNVALVNLDDHQLKYCSKAVRVCDAAGCNKKIPVMQMHNHRQLECVARSVICNTCSKTYALNNFIGHAALDCFVPLPSLLSNSAKKHRPEVSFPSTCGIIEYLRKENNTLRQLQHASSPTPCPNNEVPADLTSLFSLTASPDTLKKQLEKLKVLGATVAGIPLNSFNDIKTIDLETQRGPFCSPPECLIVLGGEYDCGNAWLCLKGTTYIGSKAPIKLDDGKVIYTDTPDACVRASFPAIFLTKGWRSVPLGDSDLSDVAPSVFANNELGYAPAVYLKNGNLIGVKKIDANNKAQGIFAAYGSPVIAYCEISNTLCHGITIHEVDQYTCIHNRVDVSPDHGGKSFGLFISARGTKQLLIKHMEGDMHQSSEHAPSSAP